MIYPGFDIYPHTQTLDFTYGADYFGPITEKRKLDDIRKSLSDPNVNGPEYLYAVSMDVGKTKNRDDLIQRNLLYGAMLFAKGKIGDEPVRSQGHKHAISLSCHMSTPEVYEIWHGEAYIYMQEYSTDDPGRCYAVHAREGDVVIVPPNYVHATINAKSNEEMLFGAWCVRDYGFDYTDVRKHQGIAWFPKVMNNDIQFVPNHAYHTTTITIKEARTYPELHIQPNIPIYTQYEQNKDLFNFVYDPSIVDWKKFQI